MEPKKRPRQDDEISLDGLLNKKLRSVEKLKNAFESIFERFSHDFSEVADEIDLETGQVVVDNGHLGRMSRGQEGDTWDSSMRQDADDSSEEGQSRMKPTTYHFTVAEKKLYVILEAKGYGKRRMLPFFPGRQLLSLRQWQYSAARLNPVFFKALRQFARNAISNEFQGSRHSYFEAIDEEEPRTREKLDPVTGDPIWSEEENARLIRLRNVKMTYPEMAFYFFHKSGKELQKHASWIDAEHPEWVASVSQRWPLQEAEQTTGETFVERVAKDIDEKSDIYYDRPWTAIEDEVLHNLSSDDDLFRYAHNVFHRSRRSIRKRLQDFDADASLPISHSADIEHELPADPLEHESSECGHHPVKIDPEGQPHGWRPIVYIVKREQQETTSRPQTDIKSSQHPKSSGKGKPISKSTAEPRQGSKTLQKAESLPTLTERSRKPRKSGSKLKSAGRHELSRSQEPDTLPPTSIQERRAAERGESNIVVATDTSGRSDKDVPETQMSPPKKQKQRLSGRHRTEELAEDHDSDASETKIYSSEVQRHSRGRYTRRIVESESETDPTELRSSPGLFLTDESRIGSEGPETPSRPQISFEKRPQEFGSKQTLGLPTLSAEGANESVSASRGAEPGLNDAVQDTDHTTSLSAIPSSSLERAIHSKTDVENTIGSLSLEWETTNKGFATEMSPEERTRKDPETPVQEAPTARKKPRKKRKSITIQSDRKKRKDKLLMNAKLLGSAKSLQREDAEDHDGQSSPQHQVSSPSRKVRNAGQTPVRTNLAGSQSKRAAKTTPQYLKSSTFKENGRPKRRLFSSSLDSSQVRRLLSGEED